LWCSDINAQLQSIASQSGCVLMIVNCT